MFRLIMVPLDSSAFAEQALPHALAIARRTGARLHLTVVSPPLPLMLDGPPVEEYLVRISARIESQHPGRITHSTISPTVDTSRFPPLPPGSVADHLTEHAAERNVDLIVMTTHGRSGLRRTWLGSTADSLMRMASAPLLLIRPVDEKYGTAADADHGFAHILVPLDGSELAEQAITYARRIGDPFGAHYTLIRVVSPLTWEMSSEWYAAHAPAELVQMTQKAALEYLETVAAPLREDGLQVAVHAPEAPYAADAIAAHAREHGVDLIVLSTSGAGGVRRLLVGSVADKVVRSGAAPVLACNISHMEQSEAGEEHGRSREAMAR